MTENFIKNVVAAMQDSLTDEQLQKLENVLAINLHGLEVKEECTQLHQQTGSAAGSAIK